MGKVVLATLSRIPATVIWVSLKRMPSKKSAEREKAAMRQFKASTCVGGVECGLDKRVEDGSGEERRRKRRGDVRRERGGGRRRGE